MSSYPTGIKGELQANELFKALVGESNAELPNIDLFGESLSLPWEEGSEVLKPVKPLDVGELMKVFHAITGGMSKEIHKEYEAGRITGAKYADTFLVLLQYAIEGAVQFSLGKDAAFWQAAKTQADAINSSNQIENTRMQTMLHRATYALTKLKLAAEDSAFGTSEYSRKELLPTQKILLQEQIESQRAQTTGLRSDGDPISGVLGAQIDLYKEQKESYVKSSQINAAKIFSDLWVAQKMADPGTIPAAPFSTSPGDAQNPTQENPYNFAAMFLKIRKMTGAPAWDPNATGMPIDD